MKIKILLNGKEVELSVEDARRIHSELDKIFKKEKPAVNPWPPSSPWSPPLPAPTLPWPQIPYPPVTQPWRQPDVVWCSSLSSNGSMSDGEVVFFIRK